MTDITATPHAIPQSAQAIDPFGRAITYLRVSVTDRCDFRCVYCMSENMSFMPKADQLTLEELARLCGTFGRMGVRKLRLTGGEPLVRRNVMSMFRGLGGHIAEGNLDELTVTTNGSLLARYADELYDCGVRRLNVSLDTLTRKGFTQVRVLNQATITRLIGEAVDRVLLDRAKLYAFLADPPSSAKNIL